VSPNNGDTNVAALRTAASNKPDRIDPSRRNLLLGASALAAGAWICPVLAKAPLEAEVSVERHGSEILVGAHAEVGATLDATWSTLADYDRLSEFIPDLSLSRTVSRSGTTAVVEQKGRASFGPFGQQFAMLLGVEEEPGNSIHSVALQGDFRRFEAQYDLVSIAPARTRIDYRATLEPAMPVPPLLGLPVVRVMIRRQFEAMVAEITRRATLVQ